MRIVWRSYDDEANFFDGEKLVEGADDANIGILLSSFIAAALQNRGEPQSGHRANHLRMKGAPGKSKSDESYFNHEGIQEWIRKAPMQRLRKHAKGASYYRIAKASD